MPQTKKAKLLSNRRPKNTLDKQPKWSSKKTRTTIRAHHQLSKQIAQARAAKDETLVKSLQIQLDDSGGLSAYQHASTLGQAKDRGGDTSKVLVEWLTEARKNPDDPAAETSKPTRQYRLLEVGCLKVDNACARSGLFEMKRIDLRSQHPSIEQQDFMEMQTPTSESLSTDGYDLISLSLILNFVSDAAERGRMLRHASTFLRRTVPGSDSMNRSLPGIFLVLPAACVTNSRYLNEARLAEVMKALGFELRHKKFSPKLAYFLWQRIKQADGQTKVLKQEILTGRSRNNFGIVLD